MKDIRAKISIPLGSDILKLKDGSINPILLPLKRFHGIIFPYSPTINISHQVDYGEYDMTHTNYPIHYYTRSRPPAIQIAGQLTAQSASEGNYMIACLHFLRIVTKMHFGMNDPKRGTPPPVLNFSAYGDLMFNMVPVMVRSFAYDLPQDVDYIDIKSETSGTGFTEEFESKIPTLMQLTLDLVIQQTASKMRTEWTMNDFKSGKLVKGGYI